MPPILHGLRPNGTCAKSGRSRPRWFWGAGNATGVRVKGHVSVSIVQDCVVTLDPVEQQIEEDFEAIFLPENSRLAKRVQDGSAELVLDPEGPDLPETFTGDSIDVGAVAAEFAALAIDPYPRKQGVDYTDRIESDPTTDKKTVTFCGSARPQA